MKIDLTWRYILAFYCLGALMGMSHELTHHVVGRVICGEWGYKTFNNFELAKGCSFEHPKTFWLATLAGPILFNYLPMWLGLGFMRSRDAGARLFGVSLVFSTVPALRIFSVLGSGDETWLVLLAFGNSAVALWTMKFVAMALIIPPLVLAWMTIANRHRLLIYGLLFIGVPLTVFYLVGIVLEGLIINRHVLADTLWGMPYMVLLAEILATIGYYALRSNLWQPCEEGGTSGSPSAV